MNEDIFVKAQVQAVLEDQFRLSFRLQSQVASLNEKVVAMQKELDELKKPTEPPV